jgi:hypothetical protein
MRWEEDMNNARWKICIPAFMVDLGIYMTPELAGTRELRKHLTKLRIFHLALFMSSSQRIHKTLFLIYNKSQLAVQNLMSIP